MIDIVLTDLTLAALLAAYPLLILTDLARHPDTAPARFQVLDPVQTGLVGGVPYVTGTPI